MHPDQLDGFVQASDPQLSPDGRHVAYVVSQIDVGDNIYRSRVWVVSTANGVARPLSSGEQRDGQPRWSPDGSMLAFCSARKTANTGGVEATLHLLPFEAPGETVLVHSSKESMSSLAFSPDGRWLAFAMRTRSSDYDITDPTLREPRKIENLLFTMNGEGFICDRPAHVYVAALDGTGEVRNLTPGLHECGEPNWFPDSTQLAIDYNPLLTTGVNRAAVVDLDGNLRSISDDSGLAFVPVVSPDGDRVATIGQDDVETMFQNNHIGLLDPSSIGAPRWISEAIDRHWAPVVVAQSPTWTSAGLLAAVEDRGNVHLYRLDPDGGAPELRISGDRCVTGWSPGSVDGKEAIAFSATSRTTPNEIFLLVDGEERTLTSVSRSWTTATQPVDGEHFLAPSGEGDSMVEVDAWIYRPKNFDASKRYPMLLNIHGGPFTQYGNVFFDEFQMQADAGYVVLCSNPRGGSGRHAEWGNAIRGPKHKKPGTGWGSVDYQDVMATVDETLRRFDFIDPDRLGVLGGSYGGYMTSWIVTHTARFAAGCSERSANNLLSLEFGSDFAGYFNGELGPRHFEDPQEYLRMSPVTYVKDLNTPLLIVHSEDDLRCPTEQATQLFVSATILEKDVEYWLFPNESHELTRSGSPVHRKRRAEIILEFFDRRLKA